MGSYAEGTTAADTAYLHAMKGSYTFEVCAPNIQSALAAQAGGAHRIELCSALDVGGITPSPALILAAVNALNISVNVLIRPREGDFCYSERELDLMLEDIRFCRKAGAQGVVVGALGSDGRLDVAGLTAMREAAGDLEISFHRAFDFCVDPARALEQLIELGYARILSSGQTDNAYEGRFFLQKMVNQARERIQIMPGAGITASNIKAIAADSGAREFHFTAKKKTIPNPAAAIQGLEAWYWESDAGLIREIIASI